MRIFVTGGAGFIGSALVRHLIEHSEHEILNFDKLTYAGTLSTVERVAQSNRYRFVQGDICDAEAVRAAIAGFRPDIVTHLAAESHVDRSIDGPGAFIQTNIVGTFTMLAEARAYWLSLDDEAKTAFRFHHISTDEVYGSLGDTGLCSPRTRPTTRARPIRRRRRAATTSSARGATPTACRCSSPIARTITGRTTSPRS